MGGLLITLVVLFYYFLQKQVMKSRAKKLKFLKEENFESDLWDISWAIGHEALNYDYDYKESLDIGESDVADYISKDFKVLKKTNEKLKRNGFRTKEIEGLSYKIHGINLFGSDKSNKIDIFIILDVRGEIGINKKNKRFKFFVSMERDDFLEVWKINKIKKAYFV